MHIYLALEQDSKRIHLSLALIMKQISSARSFFQKFTLRVILMCLFIFKILHKNIEVVLNMVLFVTTLITDLCHLPQFATKFCQDRFT